MEGFEWFGLDARSIYYLASGVQAVVIALGVLIGGFWAMYKFGSLRSIERARVDLEAVRKQLRERGVLEITLSPSVIGRSANGMYYLSLQVSVRNTGNRSEVIDWSTSGATATRVVVGADGRVGFDKPRHASHQSPGEQVSAASVLPNQTREFPFLFPLDEAGVYHLKFKAVVSAIETGEHTKEYAAAGIAASGSQYWGAASYFHVGA